MNCFAEYPIGKNDGLTLEMYEKPLFYSDGFVLHGKCIVDDIVVLLIFCV